jgi:catechol 2,3-dioxygenase-like lactoylglutathione lyase family enzyme
MEVEGMEVLTSRTIIHPRDLDRSLAFYGEGLDLPVAREFGHGAGRGVVFFAGGGLIEVVGTGPRPGPATGPGHGGAPDHPHAIALWLQVRSMDAAIADLEGRGVPVVRPPLLEPWGLVEAWIEDPDGLRIHLVEVPGDHPLRRDARVIER